MNGRRLLRISLLAAGCLFVSALAAPADDALPPPRQGTIHHAVTADEARVPEFFRLPASTFEFQQEYDPSPMKKLQLSRVTFPSPVVTPHENNNTVHCEYFQPTTPGKHPGVIVLHILGGDFELSRMFCKQMVLTDCCALFLKLPYYGPRQQPGVDVEMISADPRQTRDGMQQGILDIRRATTWLAAQEEVDPEQLGVMGISLGGITSALAGTAEPRLKKMFLMLAGGDVGKIGWEGNGLPELVEARERWLAAGRTKEELLELLRPVDPAQYGANVRGKQILMLNAKNDEIVPPACTVALWEAFGKPEIQWVDAGHYSAMRFIPGALAKAAKFFAGQYTPQPTAEPPTGGE